jgi:hypothetical protein
MIVMAGLTVNNIVPVLRTGPGDGQLTVTVYAAPPAAAPVFPTTKYPYTVPPRTEALGEVTRLGTLPDTEQAVPSGKAAGVAVNIVTSPNFPVVGEGLTVIAPLTTVNVAVALSLAGKPVKVTVYVPTVADASTPPPIRQLNEPEAITHC